MEKLLIVENSEEIRKQLKSEFGTGYSAVLASNGPEAMALCLKHRPKVVLLDLGALPERDGSSEGFRCLAEMQSVNHYTKVIIITGASEESKAVLALQNGAYDFVKKPIELQELRVIVKRAFHLHAIEEENRKLRYALDKKSGALAGIVGQCPAMLSIFSTVRKVSGSDVAVLIQGESGTGKELIARAVHAGSTRRELVFAAVHCGTVPERVLESEIFGQEAASAAGNPEPIQGKIERAQGGTLFLDEIGELPAPLQIRLLRFLQNKTFQHAGGSEDIRADVRILASTKRTIQDDIRAGRFREDLFYRIGVVTIALPPLRERREDLTLLATLFLMKFGTEFRKKIRGFSASALEQIESYQWPGNICELENKIQRAVILAEGPLIEPHDLGFPARPSTPSLPLPQSTKLKDARERVERQLIIQAMDRRKGNIAQAAEDLGISRPTFYDIMKKHGLFHMTHQNS